ncbi:MAG: hypothetical protein AAF208_05465 [Cyanobacteria bacterium P01_A01_bin.45]
MSKVSEYTNDKISFSGNNDYYQQPKYFSTQIAIANPNHFGYPSIMSSGFDETD